MTDLPPGWEIAKISDIAEVRLGRQRSPKNHQGTSMRPYLRAANISWDGLLLDDVKEMNFEGAELATYRLREGDLLVTEASGSPNEVGKPAIWKGQIEECYFQNTLIRIRPFSTDVTQYLYTVLHKEARTGAWADHSRGVGINHLGAQRLASWDIPVPPLGEQRRILQVLNDVQPELRSASAAIRTARARAIETRTALRDQLFNAAYSDARTLSPLSEILRAPMRNGFSGRATSSSLGIKTLTLTAVTQRDFRDEHTKNADVTGRNVEDLWLHDGDIFVQRSNTAELVGSSAVYHGSSNWSIFPDLLIRVRVNEQFDADYVQAVLSSSRVHDYLRRSAKGLAGSMPKIDQSTVGRVEVPAINIERQRALVTELRTRENELNRIEDACARTQERGTQLGDSLLSAAMRGELTRHDLAEEPASLLLDRIRVERASAAIAGSAPPRPPRSLQR